MKNKKRYQKLVKEHYHKEAKTHGGLTTSTMADKTTRQREIDNIVSYLKAGDRCLEVGCGNGAGSVAIARAKAVKMTCIDFSEDLLAIAKKQPTKGLRGSVEFKQKDVLMLDDKKMYDAVFTERCIINLMEWDDQKDALARMAAALKKGGRMVLVESFTDGLAELNAARADLDLPAIGPAYHNLHLDKEKTIAHLAQEGLVLHEENNFLSTYTFGSRILYPALARAAGKDIRYNSAFGNFFALLPNVGNYSQLKILVFKKK